MEENCIDEDHKKKKIWMPREIHLRRGDNLREQDGERRDCQRQKADQRDRGVDWGHVIV